MDGKIVGFSIAIIVLLIASVVGFYEYSTASGSLASLQSSYSSLQSTVSQQNKTISSLSSEIASLNSSLQTYKAQLASAEQNASKYANLYMMYLSMFNQAESNYTMYKQMYQQLLSQISTGGASYKEGAALDTAFKFWDGIAIESFADVTPYLATNFSATIMGTPFPGTYSYSSFNQTWLSSFFSNYETVYFYTTALPTITPMNNNTYQISTVIQYFVAPTNDPIYLQVFNASITLTVQYIQGTPLITKLTWMGNEVPPSTVIAGYPSQHALAQWTALSEVLSEINGMGAEFPGQVTAQYFSPGATLTITGQLPPGLMNGTYSGLSSIENFFNTWDNYSIFVMEYSQNLLPNGTAIPLQVHVILNSTNPGMAEVVANDTPFMLFVNQGQPGFPGIYDIHVNMVSYLMYNSTAGEWQIVKQTWTVTQVPTMSDTVYYNLNTPTFNVIGEQTVTVNATQGAILKVGPVMTIVKPGTYALLPNGNMSSLYNFSLILLSTQAVLPPAPDYNNLTPTYAFAFAINGQISPAYSLVNSTKGPDPAITVVYAPNTWTSWTWFGGKFNGTTYVGGSYKFADHWIYGNGVMVNTQFFKPVIWIFEAGETPQGPVAPQSSVQVSTVYGLTPINAYTEVINSQQGGVIVAGNIITVVQPGTTISTPVGQLSNYNFSVVFYAPQNVTSPESGQVPSLVFAYAVNGNVTFSYTASKPFITIITTPSMGAQMWTWGSKNGMNTYIFHDPLLVGNGVVVNLSFVKPVPWVLTLPEIMSSSTMT
ncbi:hypothetical protein L3N51_01001 [Metallosphaera sp. J1]|uniref:hypothetical protein n=1 Tax=Metallosphaera javensis (ex Hofmann et al. 2022) TaxID=99938 RepID=UPI001EDEF3F6|nr:hypothetical protein [Metallosphaera javensis (ex Hofmann et al. 2022)]MCG3108716.1 hypothetical protein [Metallosphaera javensis (ex Hofmann et al. 2022)]